MSNVEGNQQNDSKPRPSCPDLVKILHVLSLEGIKHQKGIDDLYMLLSHADLEKLAGNEISLRTYVNAVITTVNQILELQGITRFDKSTQQIVATEFTGYTGDERKVFVYSTQNTVLISVQNEVLLNNRKVTTPGYQVTLYRYDNVNSVADAANEFWRSSATSYEISYSQYPGDTSYEIHPRSYEPDKYPQDSSVRKSFVEILNECLQTFYLCLLTKEQEKGVDESKE